MKWLSGSGAALALALVVALASTGAPVQSPPASTGRVTTTTPLPAALESMSIECMDVDALARKGIDSAISESAKTVPAVGPRSLEFLIALVPDPVHTHLSLFF